MALIVQKYGGTSVGSPERIKNVAERVARFRAQGDQVIVVVSAMSGETNRLIALAKEIAQNPDPRELDVRVWFDTITIVDSNLTTIISSLILYLYGSGPIRGFAVTLILALLINLFTAVFVSRTIYGWLLSRNPEPKSLSI